MKCWGALTGDGTGAPRNTPTNILDNGTDQYTDIVSGSCHFCAINQYGILKCWGDNGAGQIGDGLTGVVPSAAVDVEPGISYIEIAAGEDTSCGITSLGLL